MSDVEQKPKRTRQTNPDRITLSKTALENLGRLNAQVEKAFGGMVSLKNKELTNFLLEVRFSDISKAELRMIKDRYFDEVRAASWALQKLKDAKERGEELKLSAILAQLQTPFVKEKSKPKAANKAKGAGDSHPPTPSVSASNSGPNSALSGPSKPRANS